MSDSLFSEFPVPSRQDWEAALLKELKNTSLDDLIQTDEEGLRLSPIADASDLVEGFSSTLSHRNAGWLTLQDYDASLDSAELVRRLKLDCIQGLHGVQFWARSLDELQARQPMEMQATWHTVFLREIDSRSKLNLIAPETRIGFDPITLAAAGLIPVQILADSIPAVGWVKNLHQPVLLAHLWAEIGCNLVDQCIYALATARYLLANELLRPAGIEMTIGVGRRLLPEIAKLRALRLVWHRFQQRGLMPIECNLVLDARSVAWNLTPEYPHNNLIRLNLQGIAAVLGGSDSLYLLPYDWGTQSVGSDHARRMSINLHHLMREESHLDKVADPLGGSYVVERLTQEYVHRIETGLAEVENQGGLVSLIESGKLRERLHLARVQQIERMRKADLKFVEVNHLRTRDPEVNPIDPPCHFFALGLDQTDVLLLDSAALVFEFLRGRAV